MKKTTVSIICDSCNAELIEHSSYPARYSLELRAIDTNINDTGMTFGCHVIPPLEEYKHFCGMTCLAAWASKKGASEE